MEESNLNLVVKEAQLLNPLIRMIRLGAADGSVLPGWSPGAHIQLRVALPGGAQDWRHYSLINVCGQPCDGRHPSDYLIAVRLEDGGRGGSRFMHESLQPGDTIEVRPPRNDFPLHEGADPALLVAGGIGVTPLISMATRRLADALPVRMVYAGRSRDQMAFLDVLQANLGEQLSVHVDGEQGSPLAVDALLDDCGPNDQIYVCGPKPMLDAVLKAAEVRGIASDRIHFELFSAPVTEVGDAPFELVLAQSGQRFTVPPDQTILDCLIEHGHDPIFDCKRGECGVCALPVLEGDIDHRDYVLSDFEKKEGTVIQVCVSRAKGARLVLDI
ncbi:MAG: PDR/VanB family oxidoreductase [Lautropia sp.]|nr:PDR/VanB family oxidoreductase [Lautropia sp.]